MAETSDYSEAKITENWKAKIWPEELLFENKSSFKHSGKKWF